MGHSTVVQLPIKYYGLQVVFHLAPFASGGYPLGEPALAEQRFRWVPLGVITTAPHPFTITQPPPVENRNLNRIRNRDHGHPSPPTEHLKSRSEGRHTRGRSTNGWRNCEGGGCGGGKEGESESLKSRSSIKP